MYIVYVLELALLEAAALSLAAEASPLFAYAGARFSIVIMMDNNIFII